MLPKGPIKGFKMPREPEALLKEFEKEMSEMAEDYGMEFKKCSTYHFHLKGVFLLNVYPTKRTVYVQGTNGKASYESLEDLIDLAKGEADLEGVQKGFRPSSGSRTKRKSLWESGKRICFVCGIEFKDFEETTLEHKIPLFKGGSNRRDNLALSHGKCNMERGHKLSVNLKGNHEKQT